LPEKAASADPAASDSSLALQGDGEGTVFRSLTVEAENRIQLDFERPELAIELDAQSAPGLVLGSATDVLERTTPDLLDPFVATSRYGRSPYLPRPWIAELRSGPVASFHPQTRGVQDWTLTVVDSRGDLVRVYEGEGEPPEVISWDGRDTDGRPIAPGLTCSYVFEARDRAGNTKRLVGEGFEVPGFRFEDRNGPVFVCSGRDIATVARGGGQATPPRVLEIASWINRRVSPATPLRIVATARSGREAEDLAHRLRDALLPLLPGDAARIAVTAQVSDGAPVAGSLQIETVVPGDRAESELVP
jgi:hypothetical protein